LLEDNKYSENHGIELGFQMGKRDFRDQVLRMNTKKPFWGIS